MTAGYLVVFRKGKSSAPYELDQGEHTIGSSIESNIRLKLLHPLLLETHAIIRVNESGIATIINKSVGAPVRVNGKLALRPTILRHEDRFEILEKTFQYFNEHLRNEPENSEKFAKEKKSILAKSRQSVNPLTKTPAKKSPNLTTKTPSIRKSASALQHASKSTNGGVQVIITPNNKKPNSCVGSKTTSKIIVSKALASPNGTRKRRLSLDAIRTKASPSLKVSSRNILLSKSTINITISEEHEYSDMTTIQETGEPEENLIKTRGRTPRRSIKVEESGDTFNKDISVALIDFGSPKTPSSVKRRSSSIKKVKKENVAERNQTEIDSSSEEMDELKIDSSSGSENLSRTANHDRSASSESSATNEVTKSAEKPSRLSKSARKSAKLDTSTNRLILDQDSTEKTSRLSRRSVKLDQSSDHLVLEATSIGTEVTPNKSYRRNMSNLIDPSNSSLTEDGDADFEDNINKSSRSYRNISKKSIRAEDISSSSQTEDNTTDAEENDDRSPRLPRKESRRSSKIENNRTEVEENLNKSSRSSTNAARRSAKLEESADSSQTEDNSVDAENRANKTSRLSRRSEKLEESAEDNATDADDRVNKSSRLSRRSTKLENFDDSPQTKGNFTDTEHVNKYSRLSKNTSRRSTKLQHSINSLQTEENGLESEDHVSKPPRFSRNTSRRSLKLDQSGDPLVPEATAIDKEVTPVKFYGRNRSNLVNPSNSSLTEDGDADSEDNINKSSRSFRNISKRSINAEEIAISSQTEDNTDAEENDERLPRNESRRSRKIENNSTEVEENLDKSSRLSTNASRISAKLEESADSLHPGDNLMDAENRANKTSRLSRRSEKLEESAEDNVIDAGDRVNKSSRLSRRSTKLEQTEVNFTGTDYVNKYSRLSNNTSRRSTTLQHSINSSQTGENALESKDHVSKSSRFSRNTSRRSVKFDQSGDPTEDGDADSEDNINKSSRSFRNISKRKTKSEEIANSSQTEDNTTDAEENDDRSSMLPRNRSRRSRQIENDSIEVEENSNKSSRLSTNAPRRSAKLEEFADSSQTDDRVNKSSRLSRRSTKLEQFVNSPQTEDNSTGTDHVNKYSRLSKNTSRGSTTLQHSIISPQTGENALKSEDHVSKPSRFSRNTSGRSLKLDQAGDPLELEATVTDKEVTPVKFYGKNRSNLVDPTNSSLTDEGDADSEDNINKSSRSFRNISKRNTKSEEIASSSQTDDNSTDAEENDDRSSRLPRNESRRSRQIENHTSIEVEENANKSSRLSTNASRRSAKLEESADSSHTEDNSKGAENRANKTSRLSRRSNKLEQSAEDNVTDSDDRVNKSSRLSRRSTKLEQFVDSPQTEGNSTGTDHVNKYSRLSKNTSRRSTTLHHSIISSQTGENALESEDHVSKSSRFSRNTSRRSVKLDQSGDPLELEATATDKEVTPVKFYGRNRSNLVDPSNSSFTEDGDADSEDNINKSSRSFRNISKRSIKAEEIASSSQTEDNTTDAEEIDERLPRNESRRSRKIEINSTEVEENLNKSSRLSANASRRSAKLEESADFSQTKDNFMNAENLTKKTSRLSRRSEKLEESAEDNSTSADDRLSKSSRLSKNTSRRSAKLEQSVDSIQTEDNSTGTDHVNKYPRLSRRSTQLQHSINSSQTGENALESEDQVNKSSRFSTNTSRRSTKLQHSINSSQTEDDSLQQAYYANKSSRLSRKFLKQNSNTASVQEDPNQTPEPSKRSGRAVNSLSSIDSTETTMDVHPNTSETTNAKSRPRLSLFDESTQEAKPLNALMNRSKQRASILDESTRGALQELDKTESTKPISILDDATEVLSPVRPLSPRKSLRNTQGQDFEKSISQSSRMSLIRRSRTKNQTTRDSSLTMTSVDQSSGSVISVSSQSFSSFKRASSRAQASQDDKEIDVVNISSTIDTSEAAKTSLRASGASVKAELLEETNASRSSKRRATSTLQMFDDVSCTSTPFHKNLIKKTQESPSVVDVDSSKNTTSSSAASKKSVKQLEMFSVSSDSVFTDSAAGKGSRSGINVSEVSGVSRRRSSSRNSVSKHAGEHNCVSCRNSSSKRSRSLSAVNVTSSTDKSIDSTSSRPAKSSRSSSGKGTSPVKRMSSASPSKTTTPLLHRKSVTVSLSEKTPNKHAEAEDETPKSSLKPARRSSKANESVYNPVLEDITPVTPEKLMVSGFTEEAFKTPINTPGLFESIRKSVIRSRKRHRESTGSTLKDSKRARVDFEEAQLQTSTDDIQSSPVPQKVQKSPLNRLSNFEGVKNLMRTPPKSPKNDLTNIPNLRRLVSPKVQASPKNDLSNVAGVRKMFSNPKDVKSPRNDLTNVPNLRRFVSPRRRRTPKNDLTNVAGVKKMFQGSPRNDLSNVSGVATVFNVSGVEVLHQGSDIENSEDLFTKLTGKRPVRAYPRGKSFSPIKEEQQQTNSRKTMGDIPVCSPRVQQWVEDHANVAYESPVEAAASEDEDVLFNVSEKPARRSKSGRSVSPKKPVKDAKSRRKTQGDALKGDPNVGKWKEEHAMQANTDILSPNSVQTLQSPNLQVENVASHQQKSQIGNATPQEMVLLMETVTPVSLRARRQAKKPAQEKPQTPLTDRIETATPTSLRGKRGQKLVSEPNEAPLEVPKKVGRKKRILSTEELNNIPLTAVSPDEVPKTAKTRTRRVVKEIPIEESPVNTETTKPSRSKKNKVDQILAVPEASASPVRRGRSAKKVEEVLAVTVEVKKPTVRGRGKLVEGQQVLEMQAEAATVETEEVKKPTSRSRRGKKVDDEQRVIEMPIEDTEELKKPASRSRRNKKIDNDQQVVEMRTEDTDVEAEEIKKPTSRSRRGKKVDDEPQDIDKKRVIEMPTEDTDVEAEEIKKPTSRSRRGKKVDDEPQDIDKKQRVIEMPTEDTDVEAEELKKPTSRSRRGKKVDDEPQDINKKRVIEMLTDDAETEELKKPASRTRRNNKIDDEQIEPKPTRRGKGRKVVETKATEEELPAEVVKKPVSNSRERKADEPVDIETKEASEETVEVVVKKPVSRGRKGKKEAPSETESRDDKNADVDDKESKSKKPVKGRKGKKVVEEKSNEGNNDDLTVQNTEIIIKKPTTTTRGKRGRKVNQEDNAEEYTDTEVEFRKPVRTTVKKGETQGPPGKRGRPAKKAVVDVPHSEDELTEDDATVDSPKKATRSKGKGTKSTDSPKRAPARGRGKSVAEETAEDRVESSEKENARKPRNKIIEEVKEIDVDSPRTARAKRGLNKKYSTDEYEVAESNSRSKRKVRFDDESDQATPEPDTRKSKRTRK